MEVQVTRWQEVVQQNLRSMLIFCVLLVVFCGLSAMAARWLPSFLSLLLIFAILGVAGWLLSQVMHNSLAALPFGVKAVYSLLLSIVVFLCLRTFLSLAHHPDTWTVLAGTSAFLLPYLLLQAQNDFPAFGRAAVPVWRSLPAEAAQKSTTFLNSVPVKLRVVTTGPQRQVYGIAFRAPVRMSLGVLFYHAVLHHNESSTAIISTQTLDGQPLHWIFYKSTVLGRSYLNPELGLLENGVDENSVIVVQQVDDEGLDPESLPAIERDHP